MAPIRVGIIGLSGKAITSWASTAHLPYLLNNGGKYTITALCNSSVASAREAIKQYKLPASTKAYGSPVDLANDDEIDLVVCSTRVDLHYETIRPSIEKGRNVYVEWPLGSNVQQAQELADLAKENGSKTVVGMQTRVSPVVLKVKQLLGEERIGKVLSSEVRCYGGTIDRSSIIQSLSYFMDREVGGNIVTIGMGHMMDYIQSVLGELTPTTTSTQSSLLRPRVPLKDPSTGQIVHTVTSNVPDLVLVHGTFPAPPSHSSGAALSVIYRRGQPFKDTPAFTWQIYGETGEIRVTSVSGFGLHFDADSKVWIDVHDFNASDTVEKVPWEWRPFQVDVPLRSKNVAALYEAYAAGDKAGYPDFEVAVRRHRLLDAWLGDFAESSNNAK